MNKKRITALAAILAVSSLFTGCNSGFLVESGALAGFNVQESLGIEFPAEAFDFGELSEPAPEKSEKLPNYSESTKRSFTMRTVEKMSVYNSIGDKTPVKSVASGAVVTLTETDDPDWMKVTSSADIELGYTNEGFLKAIDSGCETYAELPIEYGRARNRNSEYVDAYSHLVDISKYLRVYYSTNVSNEGIDLSQYDVKVSMKLSTSDTSIGQPFYTRNLCLLQYDTLQLFIKAIQRFKRDGYTVVIYDAYRPTSVQQKWFDVVKVHKWVANPSIGMGGVHDRGTAIDMSLIDRDGNELEMPTPMHTFTEESARTNEEMSDTARANMDYMTSVMVSCGFTYINSEWWHFQDRNTQNYLPTDHPIDDIPLVPSEKAY